MCADPPADLSEGLGIAPAEVVQIEDNFFAVFDSEEDVKNIRPGFSSAGETSSRGSCGNGAGQRLRFCFALLRAELWHSGRSGDGIDALFAGTVLGERLGKNKLHARQVSERGGELWCEVKGERVILTGSVVLTLRGELLL